MASQTYLTLRNGTKMPALGLGTWETKSDEEVEAALNAALDLNYRHIDTAWVYENEVAIGKVLKKRFASGLKREDIFITTKLPMVGVHPDRVETFIRKSLNNLQLEYVDLYLVHFPVGCKYETGQVTPAFDDEGNILVEEKTDHEALWKKMEEQVHKGRAKNIGVSNYNIKQLERLLTSAKLKPAANQIEVHIYLQQPELVEFCQKNTIAVVAYSPLGCPGYNKFLQKSGKEPRKLDNILEDPVVKSLAQKYSKTPAQIALRFLIQKGFAVIPKSIAPNRINENQNIFDFTLSDGDMKTLYGLDRGEYARVCDFKDFKGIENHPDFPFPRE